jgi:hypothetical protein
MPVILPDGVERLYDSFEGELTYDNGVAQCNSTFKVPFAQLVPFVQAVGGGGGGYVGRVLRMQHPVIPGMFAMGMRWKGAGNSLNADMYSFYYCDVGFATLNFPLDGPEAYLRVSERIASRIKTFPGRALRAGGVILPQDVGIPLTLISLNVTSFNLGAVNRAAAIAAAQAPVNNDVFFGYPAGTVMFEGFGNEWTITLGGLPSYTIEYQFKVCPALGWNQTFQDTTGAVVDLTLPDGVTPMLASSNLMDLLVPA